MMFDDRFSDGM